MSSSVKDLIEATADVIDEMLELDGRAAVTWRQAARALRAGDLRRALELLGSVATYVEAARQRAETAAQGIVVAATASALGVDVNNPTTPPSDKNDRGGN